MRAWVLKGGATLLTLATTAASALYVTSHLKNPSAPLQPTVLTSAQLSSVTVTPSVRQSDMTPVTSTYAS
jgi:hypothetical protein